MIKTLSNVPLFEPVCCLPDVGSTIGVSVEIIVGVDVGTVVTGTVVTGTVVGTTVGTIDGI